MCIRVLLHMPLNRELSAHESMEHKFEILRASKQASQPPCPYDSVNISVAKKNPPTRSTRQTVVIHFDYEEEFEFTSCT